MACPKCGSSMVIDEWGGWRWTCFHCDFVGREAKDEECEAQRLEIDKFLKKQD